MEWVTWHYLLNVREQDVGKEHKYWHSEDLDSSLCSALYQLYELWQGKII